MNTRLEFGHVARMQQLSDYDEIAEVLRSRKFVQGAYETSGGDFMGGTLSALDGDEHMARRRVLVQLFGDEAMAQYRDSCVSPAIDICLEETFADGASPHHDVACDFVELVERCLYRVAGAITGIDGLERRVAAARFVQQIKAIAAGLTLDWTREDPGQAAARAKSAREAFDAEFFRPSYARRVDALAMHHSGSPETLPGDALMLMLAHRHEAWPDDVDALLRETCLLLTAATQSTTSAIVHFFLRLEHWFAAHPEDRALLERDPEFLRKAAFESIRLTSGAPARIRKALEDVQLASGRSIKAGERVALLLVESNADPRRFGEDAQLFDPHRMVTGNTPPWGHAFAGGAHACPGRPLMTGSRLAGKADVDGLMAMVLRRFYDAGSRLDRDHPPVLDTSTFYHVYTSVPVVFVPA